MTPAKPPKTRIFSSTLVSLAFCFVGCSSTPPNPDAGKDGQTPTQTDTNSPDTVVNFVDSFSTDAAPDATTTSDVRVTPIAPNREACLLTADGGIPELPDGQAPSPPTAQPGRHDVSVAETRRIVPSTGLPTETVPETSNNNLDVVRHNGRIYLAWRTAVNHFASPGAKVYIVSSTDETNWRYEATFTAGTDLREPRFLSYNNTLFLYVARLGTNPNSFDPQGMSRTELLSNNTWAPLTEFYRPGFIPWRARVERGTPYLIAYVGGENIYQFNMLPINVELLTTTDGRNWNPVNSQRSVITTGGGSETDFTLGDDGSLFGIVRNEKGDETGWGSKVCRAPANDITNWTCRNDPRKYDSPYMFWYDGEAYLVGRRNVTVTGNYDLGRCGSGFLQQYSSYQLDYSGQPKRCSLWRFDQQSNRIVYLLDLPSRGDTCFPSVINGSSPGEFVVYNYSSDVNGPEVTWHEGQLGPTYIYRHVLRFTSRVRDN